MQINKNKVYRSLSVTEYKKMKKLGIVIIYLFGSSVEGITNTKSDIDIGIVLKNPEKLEDARFLYNTIYLEFSKIFKPTFLRKLDIIFLQKASITLQYNAVTGGKIIYEESPILTAEYEEKVVNQYLDFKPVLGYFDKVALKQYAL